MTETELRIENELLKKHIEMLKKTIERMIAAIAEMHEARKETTK